MTSKAKTKTSNKGHAAAPEPSARKYRKSTVVERVAKKATRATTIIMRMCTRLSRWQSAAVAGDERHKAAVGKAFEGAAAAVDCLDEVVKQLEVLQRSKWTPPKLSQAVVYNEGDEVCISSKHQEKYLQIYSKSLIGKLTVTKVTEKGQIAVQGPNSGPFLVPKRHLARRAARAESRANP